MPTALIASPSVGAGTRHLLPTLLEGIHYLGYSLLLPPGPVKLCKPRTSFPHPTGPLHSQPYPWAKQDTHSLHPKILTLQTKTKPQTPGVYSNTMVTPREDLPPFPSRHLLMHAQL